MNGRVALEPLEMQEVCRLLGAVAPGVPVWAHGSRVAGCPRRTSDLDLAVEVADRDVRIVEALREAFDESNLPFRVDVVAIDWLPPGSREAIRSQGVRIAG